MKTTTTSGDDKARTKKLARIEEIKRGNRELRAKTGICDKCGCNLCSGCDYDHDCFAAERGE